MILNANKSRSSKNQMQTDHFFLPAFPLIPSSSVAFAVPSQTLKIKRRGEELIELKESKIKLKDRKEEMQRNKKERKERENLRGTPENHRREHNHNRPPPVISLAALSPPLFLSLDCVLPPLLSLSAKHPPSPPSSPKSFSSSTMLLLYVSLNLLCPTHLLFSLHRFVLGLEVDGGFGRRRKGKKLKKKWLCEVHEK